MRIIARLNVGGPAIHTVLLTDRLDRDNYPTQLVIGVEGAMEGSMRYLAEERGIQPIVIPEMGREISWKDDLVALWKLMALMRRERPDIIHTHTAKAGTLGRIAAIIALAGRPKKLFHTFHGHVFHGYFGPVKTHTFIWIEKLLAGFTDRLIAVSDITKQELVHYKIACPHKISVIPLGLDLAPFANCERHHGDFRTELGLNNEIILIGIVARLVPIKGIHDFLQAIQQLRTQYANVHVVIVGDGEMRHELESQVKMLNMTDKVHFVGYRKDLPRIYADLDLVALSSLNEGLPVSIIEAMASGCVVVSTAVGGVPSLITDNETGFLVPPNDTIAFATTLAKAIEARARWRKIGERARFHALANYDIARLVCDLSALYADSDTPSSV
jgi:glycosyltransferase involved in cell wall biosynthesis